MGSHAHQEGTVDSPPLPGTNDVLILTTLPMTLACRTAWIPQSIHYYYYHQHPQTNTMMNVIRATRSARVSLRAPAVSPLLHIVSQRWPVGQVPMAGHLYDLRRSDRGSPHHCLYIYESSEELASSTPAYTSSTLSFMNLAGGRGNRSNE